MTDLIKTYFQMGLYSLTQMNTFVLVQMITADDFKTITGTEFVKPTV